MTQIAFGVTHGPNGPQMTTMFIPNSGGASAPEAYETHFETPEGVHVEVTFNTDNKVMADRYADELAQKSGWKVLEQEPEAPATLLSDLGASWIVAFIVPLLVCFLLFMLTMTVHFAGYITFRDVNTVVMYIVRLGLFAVPILGLTLSGVTLFTHSSTKKHD